MVAVITNTMLKLSAIVLMSAMVVGIQDSDMQLAQRVAFNVSYSSCIRHYFCC